jgi:bla regulator protein blaR1
MIPLIANHLWQSTLFAIAAGLLTLILRQNHARARHWIWLTASVKFLIPFSMLVSAGSRVQLPHSPAAPPRLATAVQQISQTFQPRAFTVMSEAPRPLLAEFLLTLWFCGFAGVLFFWYLRWRRVHSLLRKASPLNLGFTVETMASKSLLEPGVFGIFRPVLLLPERITERLMPEQLQAIIAHELCHIRRRDNLSAAIHMVVEAVFWFHPLVWWIGARLVDERERACDEEVLRSGGNPEIYAEGILNVCKFYIESPLTCVSGVTGSDLKRRIEQIMTNRIARNIGPGRKLLLAAAGAAAVALPLAIGILHAQSAAARPQFEVASIKRNTSGSNNQLLGSRSPGTFNADNYPLRGLIAGAYHVKVFQIAGAPGWIDSVRYDITAKPAVDTATFRRQPWQAQEQEMGLMLQSLLEDRFHLKFHRETKEIPIYALTVAKGGPKLQPQACVVYDPGNPPPRPAQGQKQPDFCGNIGVRGGGQMTLDAFGINMTQFAQSLPEFTERVVIDKTGLADKFNIHLQFTTNDVAGARGPADPERPVAVGDSSAPSLFTALEEQLGLKLESTKAPVEILVIDHIEKPSEN